jgi:hypothetical protein
VIEFGAMVMVTEDGRSASAWVLQEPAVFGDEATAEFMSMFETFVGDLKSAFTTLNTILLAGTAGGAGAKVYAPRLITGRLSADFACLLKDGSAMVVLQQARVRQATGEEEVNVIGYCIGGTLVASALAYMKATGDKRIVSATLFTTLLGVTPWASLYSRWITRRRVVSSIARCIEPVIRSA